MKAPQTPPALLRRATLCRASSWRNKLILTVLFAVLLGLAALSDGTLAAMAARLSPGTKRAWQVVTDFGTSGYMFGLSALTGIGALLMRATAWGRARSERLTLIAQRSLYFFAAIGISGILVQISKHLIGRARPRLLVEDGPFHFEPLSLKNVLASFPSGHTTTAFTAAVALSYMFPRARVFWFLAAVLIGVSRVLVSDHYPSDVVAGAALGSVVAVLLANALARWSVAFRSSHAEVGKGLSSDRDFLQARP